MHADDARVVVVTDHVGSAVRASPATYTIAFADGASVKAKALYYDPVQDFAFLQFSPGGGSGGGGDSSSSNSSSSSSRSFKALTLGTGRNLRIDPKTEPDKQQGDPQNRNDNPRKTNPVGPQGNDLIIRREPAKHQEYSSEETPGNGKGHRKRQHKGNKGKNRLQGNIVIDQEVEHLLEDIPENQHQTEQGHTHGGSHAQGGQEIAVENLQWIRYIAYQDGLKKSFTLTPEATDCKNSAIAVEGPRCSR